jgi:hypothetical protein
MIFDKYVNQGQDETAKQVDMAKKALGPVETQEILDLISAGVETNWTVTVKQEGEEVDESAVEQEADESVVEQEEGE